MKILLFNYKKKNSKKNKRGFDNILITVFTAVFLLLVLSQAAMLMPSVKEMFASSDGIEGAPLNDQEFLYKAGDVDLQLINEEKNNNVKILLNGEQVAIFDQNVKNVKVKEGDVIEIDATSSDTEATVQVVSKTANIDSQCLNKKITAKGNIKTLLKVVFD